MKKLITIILALFIAISAGSFTGNVSAEPLVLYYNDSFNTYADTPYSISVNGGNLVTDVPGVVIDNTLYLPLRAAVEALGGGVSWDPTTSMIISSLNKIIIEMKSGSRAVIISGKQDELSAPVITINFRTMIPAKDLTRIFNLVQSEDSLQKKLSIESCEMGTPWFQQVGTASEVHIPVLSCSSSIVFRLQSPDRIVIDIPNVTANDREQKIVVERGILSNIRYRHFTEANPAYSAARVVIDVTGTPEFSVSADESGIVVRIDNQMGASGGGLNETGTSEGGTSGGTTEGATGETSEGSTEGTSGGTTEGTSGDTAEGTSGGTTEGTSGGTTEGASGGSTPEPGTSAEPGTAENDPEENDQTVSRSDENQERDQDAAANPPLSNDTNNGGEAEDMIEPLSNGLPLFITQLLMEFSSNKAGDSVTVNLPEYEGYTAFLEENELILSFPGINAPLQERCIEVGGEQLKQVRFLQYDDVCSRIIFELSMPLYSIIELPGKIMLSFPLMDESIYGKTVMIDPGHGGKEPGAVYFGVCEKELNLDISLRLKKLLTAYGINVIMTRSDDSYVDIYDRPKLANESGADIFISIHNNALNGQTKGTETFYYKADTELSAASRELAEIVQRNLISGLGMFDRGYKSAGFVVIKYTRIPAILTEIVFMDNWNEFVLINEPDFRQKAAQCLCDSIITYLKSTTGK